MHVTVLIEGINLEKLLRAAAGAGVVLAHIRRVDVRQMQMRVRVDQLARLKEICAQAGWGCTTLREGRMVRTARQLRGRPMLLPALAISLVIVLVSSQWILRVRVENAGPHAAAVRQVLEEEGVRPWRPKATVSMDALRAELAYRLPGLSFAGLRYAGSTLICDARSAVEGEMLEIPGRGEDIVAAHAGIITHIWASSGTPLVEPGQAVHKGQVLIGGWEKAEKGGIRAVRAQGQALARVFFSGEARVSLSLMRTVETGQTRTRVRLCSPWHARVVRDAQPFASQDVSRRIEPVIGLYLPLWREIETYAQTTVFSEPRDRGDAASMAQGAAEEIAKEQCPQGALILDKTVNYSMIDNEFVYAAVILEAEVSVAGRMK